MDNEQPNFSAHKLHSNICVLYSLIVLIHNFFDQLQNFKHGLLRMMELCFFRIVSVLLTVEVHANTGLQLKNTRGDY